MMGNYRKLMTLNEQGMIGSEVINATLKAPSPHLHLKPTKL